MLQVTMMPATLQGLMLRKKVIPAVWKMRRRLIENPVIPLILNYRNRTRMHVP